MTSTLDLVRLLVVPFFAWAAYRDVRTRRIPNEVWAPLFAAGVVLLGLTLQRTYARNAGVALEFELAAIAVSLGVVAPVAYLFWLFGGFGGADAKALLVLSLLLPTYPTYEFVGIVFPLYVNTLGSFAFTVLTNTVIVGILFPAALFAKNASNGDVSLPMFLGERVPASAVDEKYGTLMGTNEGMTAGKLDLDALRMYLRWRDATLEEVRADADRLRDPSSLPAERNEPGSGQVGEDGIDDPTGSAGSDTDAARAPDQERDRGSTESEAQSEERSDDAGKNQGEGVAGDEEVAECEADAPSETADDAFEDAWGAAAFLDEIEGDAYGTTPESLREGLGVLAGRDAVWVSPGIPFIVPMFIGLVVAFVVGDLTTAVLSFV